MSGRYELGLFFPQPELIDLESELVGARKKLNDQRPTAKVCSRKLFITFINYCFKINFLK